MGPFAGIPFLKGLFSRQSQRMYKMWANIPFDVASEFILEWRITVNIPLPENTF